MSANASRYPAGAPVPGFRSSVEALSEEDRSSPRAAYRPIEGGDFTILWPAGLKTFAVM